MSHVSSNRKRFPWVVLVQLIFVGLLVGALLAMVPRLNQTAQPTENTPPSTTAPTDSTTDPTDSATDPNPSVTNELPPQFQQSAEEFEYRDATNKLLFTIRLSVGEHRTLTEWDPSNVNTYTSRSAVASVDGRVITAEAPGEAYVIIAVSDTMYETYKVIVSE